MTAPPAAGRPLAWQGRVANGTSTPGRAVTSPLESESLVDDGDDKVMVKIGVLGDAQTGKTSLVVSYVESEVTDDYVQTLGVNCMEKCYALPAVTLNLSIWDLGGHRQFVSMLPLVCNDAAAIVFMFDLTRRSTLHSIRQWYLQARQVNQFALAVMVGTKYDMFCELPKEKQAALTKEAMSYAKALEAPLFFSSIPHNVNVHKVFKVILARLFDLPCCVPKTSIVGEPIVEY